MIKYKVDMHTNWSILLFLFYFVSYSSAFSQKTDVTTKDSIIHRSLENYDQTITDKNLSEIKSLYFGSGEFLLNQENLEKLDQLVEILKDSLILELLIVGHTDSKGDSKYNKELSLKRVAEVKLYLISVGASKNRIYTEAFGEMQLKNNCQNGVKCSEVLHAANRRVEFIVFSD